MNKLEDALGNDLPELTEPVEAPYLPAEDFDPGTDAAPAQ